MITPFTKALIMHSQPKPLAKIQSFNQPRPAPAAKQTLQEFHAAGGGVPTQYKGREHVWNAMVDKFAAGGEVKMGAGGILKGIIKQGAQKVLPTIKRDENLQRFLAPSAEKRRMYHGSKDPNITEFKTRKEMTNEYNMTGHYADERDAVFLSPEPEFTKHFSQEGYTDTHQAPTTYPVYVQVEKPFDFDNPEHLKMVKETYSDMYLNPQSEFYDPHLLASERSTAEHVFKKRVDALPQDENNWARIENPAFQDVLKDLGFDSFYTRERGTKNLGVYEPNRIKSAIGNRGTYDLGESDITKAKGGEVHMDDGDPAFYPRVGNIKSKNFKPVKPPPLVEDPRAMNLPQYGDVDLSVPTKENFEMSKRMAQRDADLKRQREGDRSLPEKIAGVAQAGRFIGSALTQAVNSLPTRMAYGDEAADKFMQERLYKPEQPTAYEYVDDLGNFLERLETEYKLPPVLPEATALQYLAGPAASQAKKAAGQGALSLAKSDAAYNLAQKALASPALAAVRPMNVVKPTDGNFLTGRTKKDLQPLKSKGPREVHREWLTNHARQNPRAAQRGLEAIPKNEALNNWVDSNLTNYIQKQMGTADDPVRLMLDKRAQEIDAQYAKDIAKSDRIAQRATGESDPRKKANLMREAERIKAEANMERQTAVNFISHKPALVDEYLHDPLGGEQRSRVEEVQKQRREAGFPEEGLGQSPAAKAWEMSSDEVMQSYRAGDIQAAPAKQQELQKAEQKLTSAVDALDKKVRQHLSTIDITEQNRENLVKGLGYDEKAAMVGDEAFMTARDQYHALRNPMTERYLDIAADNPYIAKLDPNTPIYSAYTQDLGFDHIMDVLREDLTTGRIRPDQMNKISITDAMRRTSEYDRDLAAKMNASRAAAREGLPTYREYPEGYKWIELNKPGSFSQESEAMGHSVRGYEPPKGHPDWTEASGDAGSPSYGHGGWEAIKSGKAKVYSLVDSKGAPHATVEVAASKTLTPEKRASQMESLMHRLRGEGMSEEAATRQAEKLYPESETLSRISQIKGKGNRAPNEEYLPYIQDFVKGGQWSDVDQRDFRNTGLRDLQRTPKLDEYLKQKGVEVPRYLDEAEYQKYESDFLMDQLYPKNDPQYLPPQTPEGMAGGGVVRMGLGGAAAKVTKAAAAKAGKKVLGAADEVPKGVEPIVVRTPEERAVGLQGALKPATNPVRGETSKELRKAQKKSLTDEQKESLELIKQKYPFIADAANFMTPQEVSKIISNPAAVQQMDRLLSVLPSAKELSSVAKAGAPKQGWYRASTQAIIDVFGMQDAPRFSSLLAAMSPQTSVEMNLLNTLNTWKNWTAAGRPTDPQAIKAIMGQSVSGSKLEDSVLDAWVNNATRSLSAKDPLKVTLSGPKVDSFYRNLADDVYRVTNDAWMANGLGVDQALFSGSPTALQLAKGDPGLSTGYIGTSARMREAGQQANMFPSEAQETTWSWFMPLYEMQRTTGLSARELLQRGMITPDVIRGTPDFSTLLNQGRYGNILKEAGYEGQLANLKPSGWVDPRVELTLSDQRNMERAAQRLENLKEGRGSESRSRSISLPQGKKAPETAFAYATPEYIPGRKTGHLETLIDAPESSRQHFSSRVSNVFRNPAGSDVLQSSLGLNPLKTRVGTGAFRPEGEIPFAGGYLGGESTSARFPMEIQPMYPSGVEFPVTKNLDAPKAIKNKMSAAEAVRGYMTAQRGSPWNAQIPSDKGPNIFVPLAKKADPENMGLTSALVNGRVDLADTGAGVSALNWGAHLTAKEKEQIMQMLGGTEARSTVHAGDYVDFSGAWEAGEGAGQATQKMLERVNTLSPKAQGALSQASQQPAGDLFEIYKKAAEQKNGITRADLMRALEIIRDKGLPGLAAALAAGEALPAEPTGALPPSR